VKSAPCSDAASAGVGSPFCCRNHPPATCSDSPEVLIVQLILEPRPCACLHLAMGSTSLFLLPLSRVSFDSKPLRSRLAVYSREFNLQLHLYSPPPSSPPRLLALRLSLSSAGAALAAALSPLARHLPSSIARPSPGCSTSYSNPLLLHSFLPFHPPLFQRQASGFDKHGLLSLPNDHGGSYRVYEHRHEHRNGYHYCESSSKRPGKAGDG